MQATAPALRGTWTIDPSHTTIEFAVKHMMITTVKGRFADVEGTVDIESLEPLGGSVEVKLATASLDTRTEQRDDHLKSADFLDVEKYPEITFRSTRFEGSLDGPGDSAAVIGDLTIRGTTKEVILDTEFEGTGKDPWGGERASLSAKTKIDRRDFGLTWNQALETGGVLVGNDVTITLDVQLVKQNG